MRDALMCLRVGVGLTAVGMGIATLLSYIFGWNWFLVATLTLAVLSMTLFFITLTAEHPPTWGGGFWSVYVEMSGRAATGSGLSRMTRPPSSWDTQAMVNGLMPMVAAGILLGIRTLLH